MNAFNQYATTNCFQMKSFIIFHINAKSKVSINEYDFESSYELSFRRIMHFSLRSLLKTNASSFAWSPSMIAFYVFTLFFDEVWVIKHDNLAFHFFYISFLLWVKIRCRRFITAFCFLFLSSFYFSTFSYFSFFFTFLQEKKKKVYLTF